MNPIRSKQELYGFILLACLCFALNGCGGVKPPDGLPALHPTTITVIQDGQPLADASVVLVPMDPSNTWHAGATTNAAGKASLQTHVQYDGVAQGKYYIVVSKFEAKIAEGGVAINPETDPAAYARSMSRTGSGGYDLVEPTFAKASPNVTIEVVAGTNEQTVDVGKAVRVERRN